MLRGSSVACTEINISTSFNDALHINVEDNTFKEKMKHTLFDDLKKTTVEDYKCK